MSLGWHSPAYAGPRTCDAGDAFDGAPAAWRRAMESGAMAPIGVDSHGSVVWLVLREFRYRSVELVEDLRARMYGASSIIGTESVWHTVQAGYICLRNGIRPGVWTDYATSREHGRPLQRPQERLPLFREVELTAQFRARELIARIPDDAPSGWAGAVMALLTGDTRHWRQRDYRHAQGIIDELEYSASSSPAPESEPDRSGSPFAALASLRSSLAC